MDKEIISLQMSKDLVDKVRCDAQKESISVSAFIRRLLIQHYEEKNNESKSRHN